MPMRKFLILFVKNVQTFSRSHLRSVTAHQVTANEIPHGLLLVAVLNLGDNNHAYKQMPQSLDEFLKSNPYAEPEDVIKWTEGASDEDLRRCLSRFAHRPSIAAAAKALLDSRQEAVAAKRHEELMAPEKPHWTLTPTFFARRGNIHCCGVGMAVSSGTKEGCSNFRTRKSKSRHFDSCLHAANKCSSTTSSIASCRKNVASCIFRGTKTKSLEFMCSGRFFPRSPS